MICLLGDFWVSSCKERVAPLLCELLDSGKLNLCALVEKDCSLWANMHHGFVGIKMKEM